MDVIDPANWGGPATARVLERAVRMMKGEILPGRPDPEGLQELFRVVAPGEDLGDPRYVTWLYDRNPAGRAIEFITRNRDRVTGHIAIVPLRYKMGARAALGSMAVNAITHPEHRGRGIFIILHDLGFQAAAAAEIPFTFGYANMNSEKGCLRHLGYGELARIPLWILPLNLPKILASQPGMKNSFGRALGRLAGPPAAVWRGIRRPLRRDSIVVEKIAEAGPEFDGLWAAASNTASHILLRDRAFVEWRFVQAPTRRYDLLAARSNGRLVGYLAGRTTVVGGLTWGLIVDLLTEPTPNGRAAGARLVAEYHRRARSEGADLVAALMFKHAPGASALRRNGHFVCPSFLLPREFPALLRWYGRDPAPPGLFNPKTWFITLADYDAA